MEFKFIKHADLPADTLHQIVDIKRQSWNYSEADHIRWMDANLESNDTHLLLYESQTELVAYLNIVRVQVTIDQISNEMLGVGNVCVDLSKRNRQYGFLLMKLVDYYLKAERKGGLLLCKEHLISFYNKCGWTMYNGIVSINNQVFKGYTFFDTPVLSEAVSIDRNF